MTLTEQILRIHDDLDTAGMAHAFGGAFALAFCTDEPRATQDIDVNIFAPVQDVADVLDALPADVAVTEKNRVQLRRDAQSRLWWNDTPVDVFLSNHPFHDHAEANRRFVTFAGVDRLPVLACRDLAVFKAFYARPKDGVDIATMVSAGTVDIDDLEDTVSALLGDRDDRQDFFARVRSDLPRIG